MGLSTADDKRFLRYVWEIMGSGAKNADGDRWVPHAKGGEFSRYYQDLYLLVDWLEDGEFLENYDKSVIRNADYYFEEGLTYPHDTVKGLNVRYLPTGATFGAKGPGIFFDDRNHLWFALGYFNSTLVQQLMLLATPSRSWSVGIMQQLPYKLPTSPEQSSVSLNAEQMFKLKAAWDTGNEICTRFEAPWLVQMYELRMMNDEWGMANSEWRTTNDG
jgi:hypothetical protein